MYHLTTPQQNIWNLQKTFPETSISNLCGAVFWGRRINVEIVRKALNKFIDLQAGMRLQFEERNGEACQYTVEVTIQSSPNFHKVENKIPIVDFLTKKQKVNEGEVPQYFVEHSHPPIIDPEEFELVQAEIERWQGIGRVYSSSNIFSARIVCSCCGGFFGSKVWHSTSKYQKNVPYAFKNSSKVNDCFAIVSD